MRVTKRSTRLTRAGAVAAALALVASACASGTDSDDGDDAQPTDFNTEAVVDYNPQDYENVAEGGVLRVAGTYSPQGNPFHTNSDLNSSNVWHWYNPVPITFSPEGEVQFNEDYFVDVEEGENEDGGQVVTITINDEAEFNDGTPIDWRAIETAWITSNGENDAYQSSGDLGFRNITDVSEGETAKQAVIEFGVPDPWWPRLFNQILHPEVADPENFNEGYVEQARPEWGAGPYVVDEHNTNSGNVTFVRNDNWWGREGKLDERHLINLEPDAELNAFINGELDYTATGSAEGLERIADVPNTEIRYGSSPFVYKLILNAESDTLQDEVVRQAIFQSVDRGQIHDIVFQGLDHEEPLPGSNVLYFFQDEYEDSVEEVIGFDPEGAAQLLEDAGYVLGDDGVREHADGTRLELEFPQTSDTEIAFAWTAALSQQLEAIGVKLNVNATPSTEWNNIIDERRFDVWTVGQRTTTPYDFFGNIESFYGSEDPNNLSGAGSEAWDEAFADVTIPVDLEQAAEVANELERQGLAHYGWLPLYSGPSIYGVSEGLANIGGTIFHRPLPEVVGWEEEG